MLSNPFNRRSTSTQFHDFNKVFSEKKIALTPTAQQESKTGYGPVWLNVIRIPSDGPRIIFFGAIEL